MSEELVEIEITLEKDLTVKVYAKNNQELFFTSGSLCKLCDPVDKKVVRNFIYSQLDTTTDVTRDENLLAFGAKKGWWSPRYAMLVKESGVEKVLKKFADISLQSIKQEILKSDDYPEPERAERPAKRPREEYTSDYIVDVWKDGNYRGTAIFTGVIRHGRIAVCKCGDGSFKEVNLEHLRHPARPIPHMKMPQGTLLDGKKKVFEQNEDLTCTVAEIRDGQVYVEQNVPTDKIRKLNTWRFEIPKKN